MPGQFADVDKSICAAQVNKSAEVTQAADHALAYFAFVEFLKQRFLAQIAASTLRIALAKDQAAALAINLDHFDGNPPSHQASHVALAIIFVEAAWQVHDVTGRHKTSQVAEGNDQAAPVGICDHALP